MWCKLQLQVFTSNRANIVSNDLLHQKILTTYGMTDATVIIYEHLAVPESAVEKSTLLLPRRWQAGVITLCGWLNASGTIAHRTVTPEIFDDRQALRQFDELLHFLHPDIHGVMRQVHSSLMQQPSQKAYWAQSAKRLGIKPEIKRDAYRANPLPSIIYDPAHQYDFRRDLPDFTP